ncbi:MAG TPA: plastocyanin/azurin family copper-binding protein [Gemmatimonadaceae bacterium]|nr:plastocyanin/azurin family copper-binding protein [Gemmatimonadaceae bacterium]
MNVSTIRVMAAGVALTSLVVAMGCGEKSGAPQGAQAPAAATPPAPSAAGGAENAMSSSQLTPDQGRQVITVVLNTDDQGKNTFTPSEIEAHQGDVLRFTLKTGVHNVDFLADSNPGKAGLPKPSDMLQLPGQAVDWKVSLAPGRYYFQCDPHAILGMKGHLQIEK